MVAQRLYQVASGQVSSTGAITFTFPPVPQGSVWTGSITVYAPPSLSGPSSGDPGGGLYQAEWSLTRNSTPLLSYTGEAIVYDVQAVAQEVLKLAGLGLRPLATVTAVWTGYSIEAESAPLLYPRLYGGQNAYTQVYSSGDPGDPLDVTHVPDPAKIQVATALLTTSAAAQSTILIQDQTGATYRLWSLAISAAAANNAAASVTGIVLASFIATTGGTVILETEPIVLASDSQVSSTSLDMYGFTLPSGFGLTLQTGAFAGSAARVNATAVYEQL